MGIEDNNITNDETTIANMEESFLITNDFVDEEITIEEHKPEIADHYSGDIDDLLADDSNSNDEITHTEYISGNSDVNVAVKDMMLPIILLLKIMITMN